MKERLRLHRQGGGGGGSSFEEGRKRIKNTTKMKILRVIILTRGNEKC